MEKLKSKIWGKYIRQQIYNTLLMPKIYEGKTIEEACKETNIDINDVKEVFNIKVEQNT